MEVKEFLKTIYLGDRYCIQVEHGDSRYAIQMNSISRVRSINGKWNFYTDEDIENGYIVFDGVEKIKYSEKDFEFNDEIYNIKVEESTKDLYLFIVAGACANDYGYKEGTVEILAKSIYLLNPKNPKVEIFD